MNQVVFGESLSLCKSERCKGFTHYTLHAIHCPSVESCAGNVVQGIGKTLGHRSDFISLVCNEFYLLSTCCNRMVALPNDMSSDHDSDQRYFPVSIGRVYYQQFKCVVC